MPFTTAIWLAGLCLLTGSIAYGLGGTVWAAGSVGFFLFVGGIGIDALEGDKQEVGD